jgi:hypothetical protein
MVTEDGDFCDTSWDSEVKNQIIENIVNPTNEIEDQYFFSFFIFEKVSDDK